MHRDYGFPCISSLFRVPKIFAKSAQARIAAYDDMDVVAPVFACSSRSDDILVIAALSDSCVTLFWNRERAMKAWKDGLRRNHSAFV